MHRNTDGTRLVGYGSSNGLPNPPRCICREFISLCIVKFIDCTDQAGVAFLNQIQNVQASAGIFFGNRYDKAQVGFCQTILCLFVALGNALCQLNFFVGSQQLDLADLLEVHAHRIVQIVFRSKFKRINKFFLVVFGNLIHVHSEITGNIQFQLGTDNLDAHRIKSIVNMLDFLDR